MTTSPYKLAHARVKSRWASAKNYPCLVCGLSADDWALDNDAPDIQRDEQGRAYSLNPVHYWSACKRCHRSYDRHVREHGSTEGWVDVAMEIWHATYEQREASFRSVVATLYAVGRAGYPRLPRNGGPI